MKIDYKAKYKRLRRLIKLREERIKAVQEEYEKIGETPEGWYCKGFANGMEEINIEDELLAYYEVPNESNQKRPRPSR